MKLAYEIASLDDAPELVREHYVAKSSGGFRLELTNYETTSEMSAAKDIARDGRNAAAARILELEALALKPPTELEPIPTFERSPDDIRLEKEFNDKLAAHEAGIKANIESLRADRNSVALTRTATEIASRLAVSGSHELLMPFILERLVASDAGGVFAVTARDAASLEHLTEQLRNDARFSRVLNGHSSAADKARHQALVDATLGLGLAPSSITRARFEQMSAPERAAHARVGGKIVDA
jgi:hypothetical protein